MKKIKVLLIVSIASLIMAGSVNAALIVDFESYSTQNFNMVEIFSGVEFSVVNPSSQSYLRIYNDLGTRTAFILSCDSSLGASPCMMDLKVDFGQTVNNVSFDFVSDEITTGSGTVQAFLNGSLVASLNLIGDGHPHSHDVVSLISYGPIDSLVLSSSTDPVGLGYDNFSFDTVPIPGAVLLLGSGLLGLAGVSRRKK
jgi:hypothetical protein